MKRGPLFSVATAWGYIQLLLLPVAAQTPSTEAGFLAATAQVAAGQVSEGIAKYHQLNLTNQSSAALEYNRGVAHTRLGEAGAARAHWLLAERLDPRKSAVQIALRRAAGSHAADPFEGPLSWTDRLTLNEWGVLAFVFTWTWGILLVLRQLRPALLPALRGYTTVTGMLAVVSMGLLASAWGRRARLPDAVVLRPETVVRISPLDEARPAFALAEGVRVKTGETHSDWVLVEDPLTRRFGWVQSETLLQLPLR